MKAFKVMSHSSPAVRFLQSSACAGRWTSDKSLPLMTTFVLSVLSEKEFMQYFPTTAVILHYPYVNTSPSLCSLIEEGMICLHISFRLSDLQVLPFDLTFRWEVAKMPLILLLTGSTHTFRQQKQTKGKAHSYYKKYDGGIILKFNMEHSQKSLSEGCTEIHYTTMSGKAIWLHYVLVSEHLWPGCGRPPALVGPFHVLLAVESAEELVGERIRSDCLFIQRILDKKCRY